MGYFKWNDEELAKALEYRLYRIGSITEKEFSDMMADRLSKREIMWKYSKALQEVQRERNALRAENEQLKQQLAEKEEEIYILKKDYEFVTKQYKELIRTGDFVIKQKDQDKIEFAVEQLILFKNDIENKMKTRYVFSLEDVWESLEILIKQLKEGK